MASTTGKKFEALTKESVEMCGGKVQRIPDPQYHPGESSERRFTARAPFDFLFYMRDHLAPECIETVAVECKTVKGQPMPFGRLKKHQSEGLTKHASDPCGMPAGVLAEYQTHAHLDNVIVWIPIDAWHREEKTCGRKSLRFERACEIGRRIPLEVLKKGQRKKRPRITVETLGI
jgi:hypothetical protein